MKKVFLSIIGFILFVNINAQTLTITSVSPTIICGDGTDTFSYKVSGTNIPANSNIVIYQSTNPIFNPYLGEGDSIVGIKGDSLSQPNVCIRILGLFIDACLDGGGDEGQNEYMTISSGSGIKVSNLGIDFGKSNNNNGTIALNKDINFGVSPCTFKPSPQAALMANLRANAPCSSTNIIAAGPTDSIPPNAIILLFTSDDIRSNYNMSSLCAKGFPIYVLQNECRRDAGAFSNISNSAQNCNVDSNRYRHYVVRNLATGCYDSLVYDRCHSTSGFTDGTYVVNLPGVDTLSVANGGIKNNPGNSCNGIDFTTDGLNYQEVLKSSDTTFKFSIPPAFCNTGFNYIKAILKPGTPQVTSNTIQYKLVCLDLIATPISTSICSGQNAVINNSSTNANATFSWTISGGANITGASASSGNQINQTLTNTGILKDSVIYSITSKDDICTANKLVKIIVNPGLKKPNLGNDTTICGVISKTLSTANATTIWFLNATQIATNTASIIATQAGTYIATITGSCGNVSDTLVISQTSTLPKPNLGKDTSICGVISKTLSTGNATTTWFLNATQIATNTASIIATQAGTYIATITGSCGNVSDTLVISQTSTLPKPNLGKDTSICGVISKTLSTGNATTTWFLNATQIATNTASITAAQAGTYIATITGSCGNVSDTLVISQSINLAKPFIGNDTTYCGTFSRDLTTGNAQTNWTRNNIAITTSSTITINQGGTYIANITNSCGTSSDTIVINNANAINLNLGRDTVLCTGQNITLNATVAGINITYLWNTGAQTATINVPAKFQRYDVLVSNGFCSVKDTIIVDSTGVPTKPTLGNDTTFCGDFSKQLFTGDNTFWSTGEVGTQITVTKPAQYIAENRNVCGSAKDSIIIKRFELPFMNIGKDTTICDSIILTVGNANFNSILWNTSDTTKSILVINAGLYSVKVTNNNCEKSDTINIQKDCDYDVYLPTAFSPNNDNINDVLVPLSNIKDIIVLDFVIFNRWSEKVFESHNFSPNDVTFGWNGTFKNENAAVDHYTFYYLIKLQDGKIKTYKGTVALLK